MEALGANAEDSGERMPEAYRDNVLIEACGPILSPGQLARQLTRMPARPKEDVSSLPRHILVHEPPNICRMHIPTKAGLELAQAIDVMIRQGYVHRKPSSPLTWQRIYDGPPPDTAELPIQLGASVVGLSGSGKSRAIERALSLKQQVIIHERFPHMAGAVQQILWLKIDVPPSGTLTELVRAMAEATDRALGSDYGVQFRRARESAWSMARRWLKVIEGHFLGVLVLDELQNLFKLETKAVRSAQRSGGDRPPLRIKDDEALKLILTLTNSSMIPVVVCSTPDGMHAIGSRMSTSQRLVTSGFHHIQHATTAEDEHFRKFLFPRLVDFQWLPQRLTATDELRSTFHRLTAGIPRIAMALWVLANQRAISRGAQGLTAEDLEQVAATSLGPLQPAVQALLSHDPRRMRLYEDLLPVIWPS